MSVVVSERGWFSRIGGAIKGMLVGLILFFIGFPVLYKNEQNSVRNIRTIAEVGKTVAEIDPAQPDSTQSGKLVHFTGETSTLAPLRDPVFGIQSAAVRLVREVEMFQWVEKKETKTRKKLGGGEETVTTYSYSKKWESGREDSSSFHDPGHDNPVPAYDAEQIEADPVMVKKLRLSGDLTGQFANAQPLPVDIAGLPAALGGKFKALPEGGLYMGANPQSSELGDLRIRFTHHPNGPVSVIAQQAGETLEAWKSKAGKSVSWLYNGTHTTEAICEMESTKNSIFTWVLRFAGFLCMFIGLSMFFNPLKVVADVLPIAGSVVGFGTMVLAGLSAFCFSVVTIAVSWIVVRPLAAIPAVAAIVVLIWALKRKKNQPAYAGAAGALPPLPPPPPR
jgi:Transmembrane protein 43